jgi:hypothetical protein
MSDPSSGAARDIVRRDRAYAAHLFLCAAMIAWRMVETTPALSASQNAPFTRSPAGIALIMISLWLGVASVVAATSLTAMVRRDARLWFLFAAMALSMIWRRDIDVFDIAYPALAAALSAWWFSAGRTRMRAEIGDAR